MEGLGDKRFFFDALSPIWDALFDFSGLVRKELSLLDSDLDSSWLDCCEVEGLGDNRFFFAGLGLVVFDALLPICDALFDFPGLALLDLDILSLKWDLLLGFSSVLLSCLFFVCT